MTQPQFNGKIGFVVNPVARNGRARAFWDKVETRLDGHFGHQWVARLTERQGQAVSLTEELIDEGCTVLVAVGGDGTISECANGYLRRDGRAKGVALAVLPCGTGGDFRKTLEQLSDDPEAHLQMIREGATMLVDAGRLESTTKDGGSMDKFFVNIASFGISAATVESASRSSKILGGPLTYFLHTLYQTAVSYYHKRVLFSLDDGPEQGISLYLFCVGNGKFFGGGMKVTPTAEPDDGIFDLTAMEDVSVAQAVFAINQQIRTGAHIERNSNINAHRARKVFAKTEKPEDVIMIEADGEVAGQLPATFTMLEKSILMIVPKAFAAKRSAAAS